MLVMASGQCSGPLKRLDDYAHPLQEILPMKSFLLTTTMLIALTSLSAGAFAADNTGNAQAAPALKRAPRVTARPTNKAAKRTQARLLAAKR